MDYLKNFSLEGKVALITGASYGIGFAIAKAMAGAGATIVFNDIKQELVDKGLAAYKEEGIEAHGYVCDVTDENAVNELVAKITATRSITLGTRTFVNHNKLLAQYEGCVGMKTGYTQAAGRTLVSAARREGQLLVCVTLNDPDDWRDHASLFNYGFETYPRQLLAAPNRVLGAVAVEGALVPLVPVRTVDEVWYPLAEGEEVQWALTLPDRVSAPVAADVPAGALTFFLEGEPVGETRLAFCASVCRDAAGEAGLWERLLELLPG